MAYNPMKLMQYKNESDQFLKNHPKLPQFFQMVSEKAMEEGTIIEIKVTDTEGRDYVSNIRLTESDVKMIQDLKKEFGKQ